MQHCEKTERKLKMKQMTNQMSIHAPIYTNHEPKKEPWVLYALHQRRTDEILRQSQRTGSFWTMDGIDRRTAPEIWSGFSASKRRPSQPAWSEYKKQCCPKRPISCKQFQGSYRLGCKIRCRMKFSCHNYWNCIEPSMDPW